LLCARFCHYARHQFWQLAVSAMANSDSLDRSTLSISATPDDAQGRRRPNPGATGGGGGRRREPAGGGRSVALNLVLAVLVAGLMVAGWFVANQHQLLTAEQKARQSAEQRLTVLEDRLRVTDEALTETGQDTGKQIDRWESEIRKLWAVSNERNKKWIEDNQAAVAKQRKQADNLAQAQKKLQSQLSDLQKSLGSIAELSRSVAAVDKKVGEVASTQSELVGRVNSARQAVASLQTGLVNRVEENEQAVASMDAYRTQLNQRLAKLERAQSTATGLAP